MNENDDAQAILARFRELYRQAPLGKWGSTLDHRLGVGFDGTGLYGATIEFRADGTGELHTWGALQGKEMLRFRWDRVSPYRLAIRPDGDELEEPEFVTYDFALFPGSGQVYLYQTDYSFPGEGFWYVYGPMILCPAGG
jgi:hypothetical protein